MINFINGVLEHKDKDNVVVSTNGIGYAIKIPVSVYDKLPPIEEEVKIYTYLNVREDALELFGFYDLKEKEMFTTLLSVNGVGPKIALAILSGISIESLKAAISKRDISSLTKVSGIGKKTAERICLELKDKVDVVTDYEIEPEKRFFNEDLLKDATSALLSLGYNITVINKAIVSAEKELSKDKNNQTIKVQDIIKVALRFLFGFLLFFNSFLFVGVNAEAEDLKTIKSITVEGNKKTKDKSRSHLRSTC